MSTDKQKLIDDRASIEAKVADLRTRRAGLAADLQAARATFEQERRAVALSVAAGGKTDLAKLTAARSKMDMLPDAIGELDRQLAEVAAPLDSIARAIARLEVAEALAEATAIVDRLKATTAAAYADYTRLCRLGDTLEGLKDLAGNVAPAASWVADEIYFSRGIGLAGEVLGQPRGDWVHGFEKPRPAPVN